MSRVTFKFDAALPHQARAIESTAAVFNGVDKRHVGMYGGDSQVMFDPRNPHITVGTRLLTNIQQQQLQNEIFVDDTLAGGNQLGIEMETGTGKTYVYLRSILTLYKLYGFKKFLIVVPSVAIRKGVEKTIEQLQTHLKALHNVDISKHSFVYNSSRLSRMKTFIDRHDLDICIINSQAFDRDTNILQQPLEQGGEVLWDRIKGVKPIVIIDEPQIVEGASTREKLDLLEPLFELKYSATHRTRDNINMLYSLDSYAAYEQQLVKRIRVKTVYGQIPKHEPYVRYVKFNRDLTATIELFSQPQGGNIKPTKHRVENNADLHELSDSLPQYLGMRVSAQPHREHDLQISANTGDFSLEEGQSNMETAQDAAKRVQIRLAIESHFEKQWELLDAGIEVKALTLFFIDAVSMVRDDGQADGRGEYLRIFDEEYDTYIRKEETQFKLREYRELFPNGVETALVREGYFARDKSGVPEELERTATGKLKDDAKQKARIERGIDLILEKKDELISFKEPLAFIFSHSALREGWDNPNVFTLCTLRNSNSDIAKKQEIGRGLRLPVDIQGNRVLNEKHNVLTVIANDHYDHFASTLQDSFNTENGFKPEEVTLTLLQNTLVQAGLPTEKITPALVNNLKQELVTHKVMKKKDNTLTVKAPEILEKITFKDATLEEHKINITKSFNELMKQRGSRKVKVENGDIPDIDNRERSYVSEGEFRKILDTMTQHLLKRSIYSSGLDSAKFIQDCISKVNTHFAGQQNKMIIRKETGIVEYDENGQVITIEDPDAPKLGEEEVEYNAKEKTDLQIVDYIMYHTMMPRLAILKIVKGFHNRKLLNSQDKLEAFTHFISDSLTNAEAQSVESYEIINGYELDRSKILEADFIDPTNLEEQIKRVYTTQEGSKKAVYKYYNMDSDAEYDFAERLDADDKVILFTKLKKGGFIIDTPRGNYSPDWAIVYRDESDSLKLYFIVETKGNKEWEDLTTVEQDKIKCGRLHFQAVSEEIKYDWVKDYQDFSNKVRAKSFGT